VRSSVVMVEVLVLIVGAVRCGTGGGLGRRYRLGEVNASK